MLSRTILVVADISLVTEIPTGGNKIELQSPLQEGGSLRTNGNDGNEGTLPAKLKKAMETTVAQKAVISSPLCASWHSPSYSSSRTCLGLLPKVDTHLQRRNWPF